MRAVIPGAILSFMAVAATISAMDPAAAQKQIVHYGMSFPERVSGFRRSESHDFEKSKPGLGYSVRYLRPGWTVDVFVYDLRRASIPDDPKSDAIRAQFEQAQGDIFSTQKSGRYKTVSLKELFAVANARRQERLACGAYALTRETDHFDSYLCVGGWNNKFVKFRLTAQPRDSNMTMARQFLEAWSRTLWP
ncbi:MAG: hypothetical protein FJX62_10840 [Alphaproteobacteria bacterium]|nr:hypothetical protein [Alphaproteobacteria bacterium]